MPVSPFSHENERYIAQLRHRLTGALIGLARATEGNEHMLSDATADAVIEGLLMTRPQEDSDSAALLACLDRVTAEKKRLVPSCFICAAPCGRTDDCDMEKLPGTDEETCRLRSQILSYSRSIAACAHGAAALGRRDESVHRYLYKALFAVGMGDWGPEELLPIAREAQEAELRCRAMPESAITETVTAGNDVPRR